jgi:hypothetical protein
MNEGENNRAGFRKVQALRALQDGQGMCLESLSLEYSAPGIEPIRRSDTVLG